MAFPPTGQRFFTVALGSFVDAVFPPPTAEFFTKFRHPWVPPIPDAVQLCDPLEADAEAAWREAMAWRKAAGGSRRTDP
jgi:hypothetical protein